MIRKKRYKFKKNIDDAVQAARTDAVCRRPNDNPYVEGSAEHAIYEKFFDLAQKAMEKEDIERGYTKLNWKTRKVRASMARYYKRKKN